MPTFIINHFTYFFKTVFLFFERQVHIMKQKYTITIADIEMNVITEEPPEFVDELVGIIDRKIREINTASRRCSKNEAALLCALDYCSDKMKMQKKKTIFCFGGWRLCRNFSGHSLKNY